MLNNFNTFRDLCHSTSVACGWWKYAQRYCVVAWWEEPDRLNIPTKIALVHTEIREAHDYYLSGENDDHLPHLPGAAVELGDVTIRVADTAGYLQIDMDAAIADVRDEFVTSEMGTVIEWQNPKDTEQSTIFVGKQVGKTIIMQGVEAVLQLHNFAADATEAFRRSKHEEFARSLARIVVLSDLICERNDWDLLPISREKVAYNAVRADHKAEARAAAGGKVI